MLREIAAELAGGGSLEQAHRRLRGAGVDPALLAAALTQTELRERAATKFGDDAAEILFTRAGLEQATRARVASLHAARFVAAGCGSVADLGCGIGAESLALLAAGISVRPVELDPLTAEFAQHNLSVRASNLGAPVPRVLLGDAQELGAGDTEGVFLDPARRTAGHSDTRRVASPDDYSPSLRFAFGFAERLPTGVKLGPGFPHELLPNSAEAQWISVDGQLVETGVWFGAVARPGVARAALVLGSGASAEFGRQPCSGSGAGSGAGSHELTSSSPLLAAGTPEVRPVGEWLYEPDGAVIRARLVDLLAAQLGAGLLSDGIAYLTGDSAIDTPFAQRFRVIEELPAREKDLRRALTARSIGTLEIKKRGADVDPAALRKRLKLSGDRSATLILTRLDGRHAALLAERA
ncbi:MAG: THUMP-like domain-containing protein [Leucobacter sp.]